MQQRGSNTTMETEEAENSSTAPLSRGRHNSKLKVLVRSHAMREETSPPREPSPNHLHSPCIKLIPSPQMSPECVNPVVVLSPSLHSPCKSPQCLSPTTTLVPSPNSRCSPSLSASIDNATDRFQSDHLQETPGSGFGNSSPKYLNKVNNSKNSDTASKQTSHNFRKKYICDCQNQNCIKCIKIQERNINNNLTNINNNAMSSPNTLTVSRSNSRGKLRQQSSSQGSFESSSNSPCLSRDSSSEQYTDTTGVDLEQFIPETLNRNAKDRALMLRIEQELVNLAKDRCKSHYKFPPMSSYQRMLVHRCAAYFGMDHNIEPTGKSVVVNKTKNTRIPDVEFKEHVKEDIIFSEEPRRSILKRDSNSIEDYSFKSPDRSFSLENRRSKSFEEREEEYEKVRRRIFNREHIGPIFWQMHDDSSEDFGWSEIPWSSTDSDYSSRIRLQPPDIHRRQFGKLIKVHSEDTAETLRPCVAKSYSFGGYGGNISVLSRGDSVMSTHSAGPRLLTKQDSAASSVSWRLSPSSSGYKSQSQMSESVTPSPTSTPHPICDSRQNSNGSSETQEHHEGDTHIVWAVTDIHNVPKGSIIINPQTGKPLINEDGSMYHYDPNNPPPSMTQSSKPPPSPHKPTTKENTSVSLKRSGSAKTSPTRKSNLTNSSTSPSLPFSPPLLTTAVPQRNFSYVQTDNVVSLPQQHYSGYTSSFAPPSVPESSNVYQQPYIVYTAPYGVHIQQQYENRMDQPPHIQDMGNTYFLSDNGAPPPTQAIAYQHPQPPPYWNQPVTFYQNSPQSANPTPPQRFSSGPMQTQPQPGFVPTGYPSNYLPPPTQPPHNSEIVPVYANQPLQVVYQNQPTPPNPIMYQNQPPMIFNQNPIYPSAPVYPPPQMTPQHIPQNLPPYPQGTPTPNSCASSTSGAVFNTPNGPEPQGFLQLTQGMQQLNLGGGGLQTHPNYVNKGPQQFDFRQRGNSGSKGNKLTNQKSFMMGSSQSSTGTNSPAATVVAGYCPPQNPSGMYRTPPETPSNQFAFPPNFNMPPMIYRQMSNVRAPTPGTSRSSRSPTPATSDMTHFERPRMPMPANIYQGMPFALPTDPRFIPGRGQPSVYRQVAPVNKQNFNTQGSDNRSHKGRKSKANKQSGLPPSGASLNK